MHIFTREGDLEQFVPWVNAALKWQAREDESWKVVADLLLYVDIFFLNLPDSDPARERLAWALEGWSSWMQVDGDWKIVKNDDKFNIVTRQAIEKGVIIRGLTGVRPRMTTTEADIVEKYEAREVFGPVSFCSHRFNSNCQLTVIEDGTFVVEVKSRQINKDL